MPYKFATQPRDYSDLASGRVLYNLPGQPAFPVRLASEVFQRCLARRASTGETQRHILYDPCCGAAYHLSALAFEHWHSIQEVIASDIDRRAVEFAGRNLGLLTPEGLQFRRQELAALVRDYGKESHRAALKSAELLHERMVDLAKQHPLRARVFQASAFDAQALAAHLAGARVDIVLSDVPYGWRSEWRGEHNDPARGPVGALLDALRGVLHAESIVAIASDKQQKAAHEAYQRLERFQVGRRQVTLLKPLR